MKSPSFQKTRRFFILTPITPPVGLFAQADFTYDGDGQRVKSVMQTNYAMSTTYFVGTHYEIVETYTGIQVTKYYYAGSQRIAMRKNGILNYILGDHLGSTSLVTDASGVVINQTQYKAWGETRYTSGTEQTKYQYTGQYSYSSDFGLQFYNARWYDSSLGRFAQADTIVPGGSQGYDRYAYTNNNPVKYTDPTGHRNCEEDGYNCPGDKGPFPKPNPSPVVIIVCGFGVKCEKGNNGSLDDFEKLSIHNPERIETLYIKGGKYNAESDLLAKISNIKGPIILVGHSAGADAIILALSKMSAEQKIQLKGVILIDPSTSAGCHPGCPNGEIEGYKENGSLAPLIKDGQSNPPLFIYDSNLDGYDMRTDEFGAFSSDAANYHYKFEGGKDHMALATSGNVDSAHVFDLAVSTLDLFNYQYYK